MRTISLLDAIYIVHAKKGYEIHEERIRTLMHEYQLDYELMTDGDPSCFTDELLQSYFSPNIQQKLSNGVLSCTLNHILCYKKMIESGHQFAIVFENDPFFLKNFIEDMRSILEEAKMLDPGFIISLENTTLKFPSKQILKKGQHVYPAQQGRCAGAYVIDRQGAINLLKDLKTNKCDEVIDWWHNQMIEQKVIRMYWAHPPIVEQGSHNGLMSSTISSKNKNTRRRLSWIFQKQYKSLRARLID